MRMDAQCNIAGQGSHLNREHALSDQLARTGSYDADAEHALGLRIDDQFRHAVRAINGDGPARCSPGKFRHFDLTAFLLSSSLGQTAPGNFRISENDGGNRVGLECNLVAGDGFNGDTSLVRRLMSQHGLAHDVADGIDGRIVRLQLFVDLNEAAGPNPNLSLLQTRNFRIWLAADRDQHSIEYLLTLFDLRSLEGCPDSSGFLLERSDCGVEQDPLKHFFQPLLQRKN